MERDRGGLERGLNLLAPHEKDLGRIFRAACRVACSNLVDDLNIGLVVSFVSVTDCVPWSCCPRWRKVLVERVEVLTRLASLARRQSQAAGYCQENHKVAHMSSLLVHKALKYRYLSGCTMLAAA